MAEIASAYISLMPSLKGAGKSIHSQLSPEVDGVAKKTGLSFGKVFAGVAALGIGAKAFDFMKGSLDEAREAQVVGARTESVIKSMGLAGTVTAGQIGTLAGALSNKTAIDDEAIQSGQNLLLTFGNVAKSAGQAGGVFEQTSGLMVDMSAAMGTDMKSSAIQLGKALNDPIKGVSALTRVGVSFSEQQKKQIERFMETGNVAKAQGVILGEVKKQFGGAAESMATPAERAKVAWGNFQEQIGSLLLPVVDRLFSVLSGSVIPAVSNFVTQIQSGTGAGGMLAASFGTVVSTLGTVGSFLAKYATEFATFGGVILTVVTAVKAWTIAQAAFNAVMAMNPIGLVVVAIAALAAGLVYAYKHSETFRNIVNAAFEGVKTVISAVVGWFKEYVPPVFAAVVAAVTTYVTTMKTVITTVFNAVKTYISTVVAVWKTIISTAWTAISTVVRTQVNVVKTVVTTVFNAVKAVITTQMNAAKAVVSTAISAIKGAFNGIADLVGKVRNWFSDMLAAIKKKLGEAVEFVEGIPGKIKDAIGDLGDTLYNAGRDVIGGLIRGIQDKVRDSLGGALGGVSDFITSHKGPPSYDRVMLVPHGRLIMDGLIQGINDGIEPLGKMLEGVGDKIREGLEKQRDKLKSALDGIRSEFTSLKDSIAGAFTGNLFEATTLTDFRNDLFGSAVDLGKLRDAFAKLKKWGLSGQFLSQLFASGNTALILDMAAAGNRSEARDAASLYGLNQSLGSQLGGQVARNQYGPQLGRLERRLESIERAISRQGREFGRELNGAAAAGARRR